MMIVLENSQGALVQQWNQVPQKITLPGNKRIHSPALGALIDGYVLKEVAEPAPPSWSQLTREVQQSRVDQERDRRLQQFTFATVVYDFDEVSRNRIDKARGSALAAIIAGAEANDLRWADANNDFGWIAANNSFTTMDAPTTLAFGNAAAAWEGLHIVAARNLKNLDPIPEGYANDSYWPSA